MAPPRSTRADLEKHIDKSGDCWVWTGALGHNGYGRSKYQGASHSAHRLIYQIDVGPIPKGLQVCHECDNRRCVRPSHLFLGSSLINIRDKVQKNRQAKGTRIHSAKLSDFQASQIRRDRVQESLSYNQLASKYGISQKSIRNIISGKTWKHVPMEADYEIAQQKLFTPEQVITIRNLAASGVPQKELAGIFDRSASQISALVNRKTYKHL